MKRVRSPNSSPGKVGAPAQKKINNKINKIDRDTVYCYSTQYSNFAVIRGNVYRVIRFRTSLQLIVEILKNFFKLPRLPFKIERIEGLRHFCYIPFRNYQTRKIYDILPYPKIFGFDFEEDFYTELRSVYFFRYLLGFNSKKESIEVYWDGKRFHPVSIIDSVFSRKLALTGVGYKISETVLEDEPTTLWISPRTEVKRILGEINLDRLHGFITRLRTLLREIDTKYVFLAEDVRRRILDLVDFN